MSDFNRVSPIGHPDANGPDSHIIKASEAQAMKAVEDPNGPEWSRLRFCFEAIFDLAKQPGARFLDVYPAHNGHHSTLVLMAADENGNLLKGDPIIAIENGERCPPFCP